MPPRIASPAPGAPSSPGSATPRNGSATTSPSTSRKSRSQLPRPDDVTAFSRGVADARDAVERLDKRLARLEAKRKPS